MAKGFKQFMVQHAEDWQRVDRFIKKITQVYHLDTIPSTIRDTISYITSAETDQAKRRKLFKQLSSEFIHSFGVPTRRSMMHYYDDDVIIYYYDINKHLCIALTAYDKDDILTFRNIYIETTP